MHDEVHIVQQDPLGLAVPFGMGGAQAGFRESLLNFIRDGLDLPRVATRADDKVIGEATVRLVQFERGDVGRLLLLAGGNSSRDLTL